MAWQDRPVMLIAGDADRRILIAYVKDHMSIMREAGVKLTDVVYPGEDHFLFFSKEKSILGRVSQWLESNGR